MNAISILLCVFFSFINREKKNENFESTLQQFISLYQAIKWLVNVILSSQCCFYASLLYLNVSSAHWICLWIFFVSLTKYYYLVSVVLMNCSSFYFFGMFIVLDTNDTVSLNIMANVLQSTVAALVLSA